MTEQILSLFVLISPAAFLLTALLSWFQPGKRPAVVLYSAGVASVTGIVLAFFYGFQVYQKGLLTSSFWGIDGLGFSLRLDPVSLIMFTMITLLSFIIIRFSVNYLDGDTRQGAFIGRLAAAICSVQLLVLSANLGIMVVAWVLTSVSLHRLLLFYRERKLARVAARKKFIMARLGDVFLLLSAIMLYRQFGSGDLQVIFDSIHSGSQNTEMAALFLVLAAVLKSAQFPTHGWLIEVMETPTPVSALLHAGLLNAGPFLIVRMAYVIEASTYSPVVLILIGGITALLGSVIYMTQTSVKTALGFSSMAHMGFSLMVCGMGIYPAAMLHLVAHSFYKAHAFLTSGSAIDLLRGKKTKTYQYQLAPNRIVGAILLSLALYAAFLWLWDVNLSTDLPFIMLGSVIVMGVARVLSSASDSNSQASLWLQASLIAVLITACFFSLESASHFLIASEIPENHPIEIGRLLTAGAMLLLFAITVTIQIFSSRLEQKPFFLTLAIHARNGFYANALFDRMIGAINLPEPLYRTAANGQKIKAVGNNTETTVEELEYA